MGEDATWFALEPDGLAADATADAAAAQRYGDRPAAEQAATAMLVRLPDLRFVAIAEYALRDGEPQRVGTAGRIAPAQPPAPSEAEVDFLHRLPRGDPEM